MWRYSLLRASSIRSQWLNRANPKTLASTSALSSCLEVYTNHRKNHGNPSFMSRESHSVAETSSYDGGNPSFSSNVSDGSSFNGETSKNGNDGHGSPRFFSEGFHGISIENSDDESPKVGGFFPEESCGDENPGRTDSFSEESHVDDALAADDENPNPDFESKVETRDSIDINTEELQSVLSVLQSSLEGSLESKLDEMNLTLSDKFVAIVIGDPHVLGENLIGFFKWANKQSDFSPSIRVMNSLVQNISQKRRERDAHSLWNFIKEIAEKDQKLVNTEILNELICFFRALGKAKAGLEVFKKFRDFGCGYNADSYFSTIELLCCRRMFDDAWSICEEMLNSGYLPSSAKLGKLMACFCKGERAKDAHLIYLMSKEKKEFPPISSVHFLISSLSKVNETVNLASEILEDYPIEVRKKAIKPFSSVVRGLCRIGDMENAKILLFNMIDGGPPPGNAVFNFIINGYSKSGKPDEAIELLNLIENRGLRPDVYSYSVIMSSLVRSGRLDDACNLLNEAKKRHSVLTPVTYHILIRAYCNDGDFEKAISFLDEMKENGVHPNVDEYNKLIQSLCLNALDWRTAQKLLEEMTKAGLYPNAITRSLISAVKELEEEELASGGHIEGQEIAESG
ncbi:hypothetical protein AMTRI_Chr06g200910 [Amborella trichopoda]|uniref:Pentacotripeptide-repeat region of PRORP domain-containing protein n=1 Tax=Amborella trichopoda TaxID=13333 RepID=U5DFN9_AMBTC|nr:pentatricopeptide repeat-containing protein At3g02650, mitochondrial [Amborella trichopoda]ERN20282.1 hypothetical protein AMTR_s00066p00170330 [Amborella trichopoda]|eukprot:XP_006858815.1 pentatricopeptide repeat-containing protein At3g02650, mitochondrial [Amborella trichopoda]